MRGKLPYMAPEQLTLSGLIDRRTDVYAASVVLWELLTGRVPLTSADIGAILDGQPRPSIAPPSACVEGPISDALDAVVLRGMSPSSDDRFATAMDMATALERAQSPASQRALSEWVREVAGPTLQRRDLLIEKLEARSTTPDEASLETISHIRGAPLGIPTAPQSEGTVPERDTEEIQRPDGTVRFTSIAPTVRMVNAPGEPAAQAPHRRSRRVPIAVALASLLLVFAATAKLAPQSSGGRIATPAHAIDVAPPEPAVDPVTAFAASPAAVEAAFVAPPPVALPIALRVQHKKTVVAPRAAPTASAGGACLVPFRVDDDGVRIPKPGCW